MQTRGFLKQIPSESTLKREWKELQHILRIATPNVHKLLTPSLTAHVKAVFDKLVETGQLIRGHWEKRVYLMYSVIDFMVATYIENAFVNGVRSWDLLINHVLGVLLQVAANSRAGDIARFKDYTGMEALCWKDIQLVLNEEKDDQLNGEKDELSVDDFHLVMTLRYCKGMRYGETVMIPDSTNFLPSYHLNLDQVRHADAQTPDNYHCDVIKFLIIHGLRHGTIGMTGTIGVPIVAITAEQVVSMAKNRVDKRVPFLFPEQPILGHSTRRTSPGLHVYFDKPASAGQLRETYHLMGLLAGVQAKCTSRGARNGSARDLAHLDPSNFTGIADATTAAALGHDYATLHSGVTALYAGDS